MNRRAFLRLSTLAGVAAAVPRLPAAQTAQQTYTSEFDVLSHEEIEKHFELAPKRVFQVDGCSYMAKTSFSRAKMTEKMFKSKDWRRRVAPAVIKDIKRHQAYYAHHFPGSRIFVYNTRAHPDVYVVLPDYTKEYPITISYAVVKPAKVLTPG